MGQSLRRLLQWIWPGNGGGGENQMDGGGNFAYEQLQVQSVYSYVQDLVQYTYYTLTKFIENAIGYQYNDSCSVFD